MTAEVAPWLDTAGAFEAFSILDASCIEGRLVGAATFAPGEVLGTEVVASTFSLDAEGCYGATGELQGGATFAAEDLTAVPPRRFTHGELTFEAGRMEVEGCELDVTHLLYGTTRVHAAGLYVGVGLGTVTIQCPGADVSCTFETFADLLDADALDESCAFTP